MCVHTYRQRDELEDQLRHISMEREKIKKSMVWCLDHSESAEEVRIRTYVYVCMYVCMYVCVVGAYICT